jgi:N-acetylglucosaminyldiphosphoundecaprenol N-acetyl-beta-D-mannosaminyltransferase
MMDCRVRPGNDGSCGGRAALSLTSDEDRVAASTSLILLWQFRDIRSMVATADLSWVNATAVGAPLPVEIIGGLPIAVIDRAGSARLMIDLAAARRNSQKPALVFTSANGQVLSMCASHADIRQLFVDADLIHADGTPIVLASRLLCRNPLPERVATTDLFHDVAKLAQARGTSFYMLGGTSSIVEQAVRRVRALYPALEIVGHRDGYFSREQEPEIIDKINRAQPDVLWLGMGAPAEQRFAMRNRDRLRRVGIIKTSGGLFDFLSGRTRRAPRWMQAAGLEWAFRTLLEPRRLASRYIMTNPHALFLLATRTRTSPAREIQ